MSGGPALPAARDHGLIPLGMPHATPDREPGVVTQSRPKPKTKQPPVYKVLFHNDDYTTMEFVVWVLQAVFHHDETTATEIMLHVHRDHAARPPSWDRRRRRLRARDRRDASRGGRTPRARPRVPAALQRRGGLSRATQPRPRSHARAGPPRGPPAPARIPVDRARLLRPPARPRRGGGTQRLRARRLAPRARDVRGSRAERRAAAARPRPAPAADARLPAHPAARRGPRAVLGQGRGRRPERP